MALAAKLQLRQSQSLVMTPQLMQSIRLLQLTHVELQAFIDVEIERNPLLERMSGDTDLEDSAAEVDASGGSDASGEWFETDIPPTAETMADRFDSSIDNLYPDEPGSAERCGPGLADQWKSAGGAGAGSSTRGSSDGYDIDDFANSKVSLREHVSEQIAFAFETTADRLVAAELAGELDESGYFRGDLDDIAKRLEIPRRTVLSILDTCQSFEPTGLFARDLAECLGLQLRAKDRLDPAMAKLVANLELVARRDFVTLRRLCGVDAEDMVDMIAEIRGLDPRPGSAFTTGVAEIVIPDVIVRAASDGSWLVELNADTLPRVLVDNAYFAQVSSRATETRDREFLSECMQNANWLSRSLDQRAKTIMKVATEIVRQQDAFLAHGVRGLRPLNLKTVADAIGMHESTVSRVTANKHMHTPRGVFELRYFFTAAIQSVEGGESHSSESVRDRIKAMIDAEGTENVLSDDSIVDMLRKAGIEIARRTVAKYRDALRIPSSVQRRREKTAVLAATSGVDRPGGRRAPSIDKLKATG